METAWGTPGGLPPSHRETYQRFLTHGFLPVRKEEIALYRRWINGWTLLTELSAANLSAWGIGAYSALYKVIHGYFCSAWFPCGGGPLEIQVHPSLERPRIALQELVDALWETASGTGNALAIYTIEEHLLKAYTDVQGYSIQTDWTDDRGEYIYRIQDLLDLSGKENEKKRRHLRKCAVDDRVFLMPMSKENVQTCVELQNQWCGQQDCAACAAFCGCEKKAIENMAAIFDDDVYKGAYLYAAEKPAGFAIWERLDKERGFLYFIKALVSNFNTYLYYKAAETYFADAETLSIGSDMGKPGLRFFKRHLGRHTLARKYRCVYSKRDSV
jgi:hypothetical protein